MLSVQGLSVTYGTGASKLLVVDDVSFVIPTGSSLGLVGESGSGKSTIARAIVGLLPLTAGEISLDDETFDARKLRSHAYHRRVQIVFQDPSASLNPRMTVGQAMNEALALRNDVSRSARREEAIRTLTLVGMREGALQRYPHQFSGGQLQRIAIARVLAVKPEVVILDEVTSALDVSIQASILNLLLEIQEQVGVAYLVISHDLSVIRHACDQVAVLYLGRVIEQSTTNELFSDPNHPYTRALLASVPKFGADRRPAPLSGDLPDPRYPPPGCRFHTRCPVGPLVYPERINCTVDDPRASAASRAHHAACHYAGPDPATGATGTPPGPDLPGRVRQVPGGG
jgi:peptide/nickel transport system ATP-binding protein